MNDPRLWYVAAFFLLVAAVAAFVGERILEGGGMLVLAAVMLVLGVTRSRGRAG